jgi:hypothetical protein
MRHESVTQRDLVSLGKGVSPILAVAAAAMPASAMSAAATSTESAMLAFTTMLVEPRMPMRKAVAPATMIPVIAPLVESVSVVAVANGPVANGPVANGLRHARGQGKTDADQQRYGPRQYSAVIHCRLRFL